MQATRLGEGRRKPFEVIDFQGVRMERMTGVEPASTAWEAVVLPMNYIREVALLAHKWLV